MEYLIDIGIPVSVSAGAFVLYYFWKRNVKNSSCRNNPDGTISINLNVEKQTPEEIQREVKKFDDVLRMSSPELQNKIREEIKNQFKLSTVENEQEIDTESGDEENQNGKIEVIKNKFTSKELNEIV